MVDPPGHHALDRRPGAHHPHSGAHDRDHQQTEPHFAPDASGNGPRSHSGRAGQSHGDAGRQDPQGDEDRQGTDFAGHPDRRRRRFAPGRFHRGQQHRISDGERHQHRPARSGQLGAGRPDPARSESAAHAVRHRHEHRPHPRGSRQAVRRDPRTHPPDRSQGAAQAAPSVARRHHAFVPGFRQPIIAVL